MVLPHDVPVMLWGSGAPGGDTVRVSIAGQTAVARSDWQGRWMVRLAPLKPGGPFQMVVQIGGLGKLVPSSAANTTDGLELNDVLVGEVLFASMLPALPRTPQKGRMVSGKATHPFALVRVRAAHGDNGSWLHVFNDAVPRGSEDAFAQGSALVQRFGMPVGILEPAGPPPCPPSTRCSAH